MHCRGRAGASGILLANSTTRPDNPLCRERCMIFRQTDIRCSPFQATWDNLLTRVPTVPQRPCRNKLNARRHLPTSDSLGLGSLESGVLAVAITVPARAAFVEAGPMPLSPPRGIGKASLPTRFQLEPSCGVLGRSCNLLLSQRNIIDNDMPAVWFYANLSSHRVT
ncbi:hypothetical protein BDV95DRAFT_568516 [Massariosphaeria phaeospora]|uniref:Uncharacterized protein n=1 Tax=Massariosphaeria phaeospora TaxID=100035 RepID=A0A7C8MC74_9PLEO|nr:hypothetical protein BDV95DRAFT_568516 [Massariosphaeria phaeospora]